MEHKSSRQKQQVNTYSASARDFWIASSIRFPAAACSSGTGTATTKPFCKFNCWCWSKKEWRTWNLAVIRVSQNNKLIYLLLEWNYIMEVRPSYGSFSYHKSVAHFTFKYHPKTSPDKITKSIFYLSTISWSKVVLSGNRHNQCEQVLVSNNFNLSVQTEPVFKFQPALKQHLR